MPERYFIRKRGKITGPFNLEQLLAMRSRGRFSRANEVSTDRLNWQRAAEYAELFPEGNPDFDDAQSYPVGAGAEPSPFADQAAANWDMPPGGAAAGDIGPASGQIQPEVEQRSKRRANLILASITGLLVVTGMGFAAWQFAKTPPPTVGPVVDPGAVSSEGHLINVEHLKSPDAIAQGIGLVVCGWNSRAYDGLPRHTFMMRVKEVPGNLLYRFSDRNSRYEEFSFPQDRGFVDLSDVSILDGTNYKEMGTGTFGKWWDPDLRSSDGKLYELKKLGQTGSCFFVSTDGYAITAKHIVEEAFSLQGAKLLDDIVERFKYTELKPTVWVFVNGKVCEAEAVHLSSQFDLAIIKINEPSQVAFALADQATLPTDQTVWALGFPTGGRGAVTSMEEKLKDTRFQSARTIKEYFLPEECQHSQKKGFVSTSISRAESGNWIHHTAPIARGDSGGPLVTRTGTVYGINIWSDAGESLAFSMQQMRSEIDQYVKKLEWRTPR